MIASAVFTSLNVCNLWACGCTNPTIQVLYYLRVTVPLKPLDRRHENAPANCFATNCFPGSCLRFESIFNNRFRTKSKVEGAERGERVRVLKRNLFKMPLFWQRIRISDLFLVILKPLSRCNAAEQIHISTSVQISSSLKPVHIVAYLGRLGCVSRSRSAATAWLAQHVGCVRCSHHR